MEDGQNLNLEIKSLFDLLKSQAIEYNQSLDQFKFRSLELEKLIKEYSDLKESITEDIQKKNKQYDEKITNFIDYISYQYEKLKNEYKQLKNFNQINSRQENLLNKVDDFHQDTKDKFDKLINEVETYKQEIFDTSVKYKDKAKNTLIEIISDSKENIESSISEKTNELKEEIIFRQRKIEGLLKAYETDLKDLQREVTINRTEYLELINEIQEKIDNEDPAAKVDNKSLIDNLSLKVEDINGRLSIIEKTDLKTVSKSDNQSNVQKNLNNKQVDNTNYDITNDIVNLKNHMRELQYELEESDKKNKSAYIIAFMSIVFALISIIITFI